MQPPSPAQIPNGDLTKLVAKGSYIQSQRNWSIAFATVLIVAVALLIWSSAKVVRVFVTEVSNHPEIEQRFWEVFPLRILVLPAVTTAFLICASCTLLKLVRAHDRLLEKLYPCHPWPSLSSADPAHHSIFRIFCDPTHSLGLHPFEALIFLRKFSFLRHFGRCDLRSP